MGGVTQAVARVLMIAMIAMIAMIDLIALIRLVATTDMNHLIGTTAMIATTVLRGMAIHHAGSTVTTPIAAAISMFVGPSRRRTVTVRRRTPIRASVIPSTRTSVMVHRLSRHQSSASTAAAAELVCADTPMVVARIVPRTAA